MFWKVVGAVYGALLVVSLVVGLATPNYWGVDLGWLMVSLLGIYTVASLRFVKKDEIGGILFLEKPVRQVGPGVQFAPLGIMSVTTVPSTAIDIQIPGPREKAWAEESVPPEGFFIPARVTFKREPGTDDPLNERVTAEMYFFVRLKIKDVLKFWPNLGSVEELEKEITQTVIATATEVLTQKTVAEALQSFAEVNESIKKAIEELVGERSSDPNGWGIDLLNAQMLPIGFNHDLNKAISGLPKATLTAKATEEEARGTKQKLILEGEGNASAQKNLLLAEVEALTQKKTSMGVEGGDLLALDALAEGLKAGQVIISGDIGLSGLLKMVEAVKPKTQTPPPTQ
ncbi:MAG TPA: SPFH domain-containing protein [Candidatus Paceibacterota bacterium]|nr:SPFH domain-containing protein [Candidatus Paceibacterota bacterium]